MSRTYTRDELKQLIERQGLGRAIVIVKRDQIVDKSLRRMWGTLTGVLRTLNLELKTTVIPDPFDLL